ncbi:DUF1127 domain-containing protein [Chelativorans sp. AA-79]|uniref:DUF1127 domain-containing protein n=1 Tax=Chelativorans sp. AA-79 TaxID=3028735 RepID=UPI0023F74023|nr:DUF1127 domain-containing protein [Chelativorans sp. AA-79]WEX08804.1 DUF1127 domain-containing protein [Chelativorans sp. AA-79]
MRAEQTALPTAAVRLGFVLRLARVAADLRRLFSNRRAMRKLSDLSDWELVDIGLTREDIARAYDGHVMEDPTRRLVQIMQNRTRNEGVARRQP